MCIMNKNSYDIEQCNTTDVTCDDNNLTNRDNAKAIEEIRRDTNDTKFNLLDQEAR